MPASVPNLDEILYRLQLLDDKIKYASKLYKSAIDEDKPGHELKRLKQRVETLKKERCLYYNPMQKLKPHVGYQSYLYNKIESISQFNSSRYL